MTFKLKGRFESLHHEISEVFHSVRSVVESLRYYHYDEFRNEVCGVLEYDGLRLESCGVEWTKTSADARQTSLLCIEEQTPILFSASEDPFSLDKFRSAGNPHWMHIRHVKKDPCRKAAGRSARIWFDVPITLEVSGAKRRRVPFGKFSFTVREEASPHEIYTAVHQARELAVTKASIIEHHFLSLFVIPTSNFDRLFNSQQTVPAVLESLTSGLPAQLDQMSVAAYSVHADSFGHRLASRVCAAGTSLPQALSVPCGQSPSDLSALVFESARRDSVLLCTADMIICENELLTLDATEFLRTRPGPTIILPVSIAGVVRFVVVAEKQRYADFDTSLSDVEVMFLRRVVSEALPVYLGLKSDIQMKKAVDRWVMASTAENDEGTDTFQWSFRRFLDSLSRLSTKALGAHEFCHFTLALNTADGASVKLFRLGSEDVFTGHRVTTACRGQLQFLRRCQDEGKKTTTSCSHEALSTTEAAALCTAWSAENLLYGMSLECGGKSYGVLVLTIADGYMPVWDNEEMLRFVSQQVELLLANRHSIAQSMKGLYYDSGRVLLGMRRKLSCNPSDEISLLKSYVKSIDLVSRMSLQLDVSDCEAFNATVVAKEVARCSGLQSSIDIQGASETCVYGCKDIIRAIIYKLLLSADRIAVGSISIELSVDDNALGILCSFAADAESREQVEFAILKGLRSELALGAPFASGFLAGFQFVGALAVAHCLEDNHAGSTTILNSWARNPDRLQVSVILPIIPVD